MAEKEIWNSSFTETVKSGAPSNQAQFAIFYRNQRGAYDRLTQMEGNSRTKNAEVTTRNLIGQTAPKDIVMKYSEEFTGNVIIEKDEENYEFFNLFQLNGYTGRNAELDMLMVDFKRHENLPPPSVHKKYLTYSYKATVTVDTVDDTEGILSVKFKQASDQVFGTAQLDENEPGEHPVFTPSIEIPIGSISLSDEDVTVNTGKEKWVAVLFSPLACPYDFEVGSDEPAVCKARRERESVVITGLSTGTAVVTVTSTTDATKTAEIEVTVQ